MFDDQDALGTALADEILERYARTRDTFLLGCPGGRSLRSTYRSLGRREARFDRLVVVLMDEYAGIPEDALHSNRRFAREELAGPFGLDASQVWVPSAQNADGYDAGIENAGGIDVFLLGCGASDGHVGFLPPGSPRNGGTAVVELAESTRRDNLVTFPHL